MHLGVIFETIGGYHAARLAAASAACAPRGWRFTAVEITNAQAQHPWGDVETSSFARETVVKLENNARGLSPQEFELAAERIGPLLDRMGFDAVAISGWGFAYSRAALSWCRRRKAAAILMSESKRDDALRSWWKELLKSWLYVRRFDSAIVGSESHRKYLHELGMPPERIFTGYDVVDNDYFAREATLAREHPSDARERQPRLPQRPYFICATRFLPRKNVLRMLSAYAAYRAAVGADAAWDLVICGSGEQAGAIDELIGALHLESYVHLPGFVSYRDMPRWYGLASAFIHPALHEQWGLVVNEAMAAGLPVLVSKTCGCYEELVRDGETGLGFDPASADSITGAMTRVTLDPVLAARLGAAATRHIANFAPRRFGTGLVEAALAATAR